MQNNWSSEGRDEEGHLTAPTEKGQFVQKNLEEGVYRIIPDLPDDNWYIRSLTQSSKGGPGKGTDVDPAHANVAAPAMAHIRAIGHDDGSSLLLEELIAIDAVARRPLPIVSRLSGDENDRLRPEQRNRI